MRVSCEKTKDEAPFRAYYLAPLPVTLGADQDGEPLQSLVLIPSDQVIRDDSAPLSDNQVVVMQAIEAESTISLREIGRACGLNLGTVQRAVKAMQDAGYLEYDGRQRHLTTEGENKLRESLYRDTEHTPGPNGKDANRTESGDTADSPIQQDRLPGLKQPFVYS